MDTVIRERSQSTADAAGDVNTPFIDLTICPAYDSAYKDYVLEAHGIDKEKYRTKGIYSPTINNRTNTDLRDIFDSITYDVDEILFRVVIKTMDKQKPKIKINFGGSNFTEHVDITTKYWPSYGRCFSMHPTDGILEMGVTGIEIASRISIYVYFGYPGQFMYVNTKSKVSES